MAPRFLLTAQRRAAAAWIFVSGLVALFALLVTILVGATWKHTAEMALGLVAYVAVGGVALVGPAARAAERLGARGWRAPVAGFVVGTAVGFLAVALGVYAAKGQRYGGWPEALNFALYASPVVGGTPGALAFGWAFLGAWAGERRG